MDHSVSVGGWQPGGPGECVCFFAGGVETEEQLDAALQGLKETCERHIGAGKKVLIQSLILAG